MNERVLYCHPGAELYGSDRMALETVKALTRTGKVVEVVLPVAGPLWSHMEASGISAREVDVPVLRKEYLQPRRLLSLVTESLRAIGQARREIADFAPDVVYVNTITQPVWIIAGWLSRKRVIVHVREAEDDLGRLLRGVLVAPLKFATVVVSNSKSTDEFVERSSFFPLPNREVIYNGKSWDPYAHSADEASAEPLDIIVVGRLSPRKGQDVVIDALALLHQRGRKATLAIVGDVYPGYEWYRDDLLEQAERLGVSAYCRFVGFVSDPETYLARSKVAVVPSRAEPFGTVAAEAMAAGKPTIVARTQGLIEIVEDEVSGLVVPSEDAPALAHALERILGDEELAADLAEAGARRVHDLFSPELYGLRVNSVVDAEIETSAQQVRQR
ncbi:glycosyltransferase family 4 protein [Planctomonas deserti]|uniref:glycosyltransferase family 4 protein n=1 Tax=Planctomonas deserti TaxID=2144185 RepID=UPI000D34E23A|nr:glycosyltransferase family 4 protein [Planctomonas deserti]